MCTKKFIINILALTTSLLVSLKLRAEGMSVINVRRNIPLSDEEEIYRDYYISGGSTQGLKKNLVVTAVRKMQIRDASGATSFGEVAIPVGQLRIIATFDNLAVAREYKTLSRIDLPMIEQTWIMVGDMIDPRGSYSDSKYKEKKSISPSSAVTSPPPRAPIALTPVSSPPPTPTSVVPTTGVTPAIPPTAASVTPPPVEVKLATSSTAPEQGAEMTGSVSSSSASQIQGIQE